MYLQKKHQLLQKNKTVVSFYNTAPSNSVPKMAPIPPIEMIDLTEGEIDSVPDCDHDSLTQSEVEEVSGETVSSTITGTQTEDVCTYACSTQTDKSTKFNSCSQTDFKKKDVYTQTEVRSLLAGTINFLFDATEVTDEDVNRLRNNKLLSALVRNVLKRVTKHHTHDKFVKNMFVRWSILGNVSDVVNISTAVGGPLRSTLSDSCQPSVPVLDYANGSNISAHIKEFSNILESRLPHGVKNSEVPCIITTDATAVTGRVGIKRSPYTQGYNVYGLDHKFNQPVTINIEVERDNPVFTSSNTKGIHMNGLENFPALLESKKIARVNYVNAFILVPLIEKAFPYNILSFPVGTMCKASDLLAAYEMVKVSATKGGIHVFTLPGDGDSRLTSIQHSGMFNTLRTEHSLLNTLEYPPMLAFSSSGDFPTQDICHSLKKLVNNMHFHSTRLLFLADTEEIKDSTFVINWSVVLELAATNENFRDCLSLTTLQHADKQNPACACELFATEAGFLGAGAYFKAAYLLLAAFYSPTFWCGRPLWMIPL